MAVLIVFEYEVDEARHERFEAVYGPDGEWAAFFRTGAGYLGTELRRDVADPSRYLVLDRWESREAYEAFLAEHRDEYDRRGRETERLYRRETAVGRFTEP